MARVIGSEAGGYATLQPTENYIGEAIQQQEANAFKYRAEAQAKEAKMAAAAKARQDALDKDAQQELEDFEKINAIKAKDSGISGIQSAVVNGMQAQREKYIEAVQNYRKTRDKKYLIQSSEAMNNLNSIAGIPDAYKLAVDNIRKGVDDGTLDRSEEKRITKLGDEIEKGFIVPKIENGIMSFDIFNRDPNTGQLSGIAANNIKGQDLLSRLTPHKKLDYNKHIKEIQGLAGNPTTSVVNGMEIQGFPNAEKYAAQKASQVFQDENLLDDIAQAYGIEESEEGYSPQEKQAIYDRYYKDVLSGLNTGRRRDYEAEKFAFQKQKEARIARSEGTKNDQEAFAPPIGTVTKGGYSVPLGLEIKKGGKVFSPTYEKGKDGAIKGVVPRNDGSYSFSISARKDDSLNAKGIANKRRFEEDPQNAGAEYEPVESDYVYSASKPTEFNTKKDAGVINNYVRGMLNPANGKYFNSVNEYIDYYDRYRPKSKSPAKKQASSSKGKTYAGIDEQGNIIYK